MNFEGLDVDIGERQTLINEGLLIPNRANSNSRHPINDLTYHQPFHNKPIPNLLEEYRKHKKRNGLILTGVSLCFLLVALAFFIPLILELYLEGYKSPTNPFANITLDFTITGAVIGGFDLIFIIGMLIYFLREKKRKEMEGEENSLIEMSRGDYIAIWKIQVEDEVKGHSQWKNYVDHIYGVDGWPFKPFSIQSYAKYFILYIIISALIFGLFSLRLILSGNIWLFPEDRNLFNYIVAAVISLFLTFIVMISSFSIFVGYTKYRYYTSLNIKPSIEFIISLHGVYCRELHKITIWKPILLDNIMSSKYEYKINSIFYEDITIPETNERFSAFIITHKDVYTIVVPVPNTLEEEEINNVYVILRSICANQIESEEERSVKVNDNSTNEKKKKSKRITSEALSMNRSHIISTSQSRMDNSISLSYDMSNNSLSM